MREKENRGIDRNRSYIIIRFSVCSVRSKQQLFYLNISKNTGFVYVLFVKKMATQKQCFLFTLSLTDVSAGGALCLLILY